ncbi:Putative antitoxin VapB29 [Dietzia timorensis]|uniref:Putative antitoxin VapB29 n=2 Tax=Dietzia timorensis TaxID=499555 RepID=A0A173LHD1_9ACTN|nr:Putative antitoxin VapB29 [Dietzia timorensis]
MYHWGMRTTIDLPDAVHRRAKELAQARGESLSSVVADLAVKGLAAAGEPMRINRDPVSGLPTVNLGYRLTSEEVARELDDE